MTRTLRMAVIGLFALSALAPDRLRRGQGQVGRRSLEAGRAEERRLPGIPEASRRHGDDRLHCRGRFIWTIVKDGKVVGVAGGRYKAEKDKFTEIIEYVSGQGIPESFVGSSFEFTVKVDGDTMTKVGTIQVGGQDYKIDEKWERCKP